MKGIVIALDLVFLALEILVLNESNTFASMLDVELETSVLVMLCAYAFTISFISPVAHNRQARADVIVARCFRTALMMVLLMLLALFYVNGFKFTWKFMGISLGVTFLFLTASRLIARMLFKMLRKVGRDSRHVVLVGSTQNVVELWKTMAHDPATGYRLNGYFNDEQSRNFGDNLAYLGKVKDILTYLDTHHTDMLFCALPSSRAEEILLIINYCENHLVRFYSVPNVRNYVHRSMTLEFLADVPVMAIREDRLRQPLNRIIKRGFDVVFSLLFLCTVFIPVFLVCAVIIKLSSPGPVFFCQDRNGLNGKLFRMIKFRSMHVNKDADSVQATKDDPRKFRFGDFMRRTNIDELPQFINVLLGDMSIVGPRPHMLKHTEEYSALINRYMVRHFAKPGITGWAQVNGARGETRELRQMEERIQKDLWYVEHWTFWLDLRIIYLTIRNMILGEKNAY